MSKRESNPLPPSMSNSELLNKHLFWLGYKVRDKVTGVKGIVTSVCFDLYGCIQAIIDQGVDKNGKKCENYWYDISRLELIDRKKVMEVKFQSSVQAASGEQGAADKPVF